MAQLISYNKQIACTPFETRHVEKVVKGGFAMADKKVQLQELTVLLPTADGSFKPGDKIYVKGTEVTQRWATDIWNAGGKEFILVPETALVLAIRGETPWQSGC